jgi:hypothetical protein
MRAFRRSCMRTFCVAITSLSTRSTNFFDLFSIFYKSKEKNKKIKHRQAWAELQLGMGV